MALRSGVDDGPYVALQGAYPPNLDFWSLLDALLHGADLFERDLYTYRGLWLLWRCAEIDTVADLCQECGAAPADCGGLVALSPRQDIEDVAFGRGADGVVLLVEYGAWPLLYRHLPLLDFLPYRKGVNIAEAMEEARTRQAESEVGLVYRNRRNGRLRELSLDD